MPNLKITIPKPCSESWENMKPLEQGRFCDSCEKEVIDFTKFSTRELADYFKYSKGHVCGRINSKHLEYFNPQIPPKGNFKYISYKLFVASCLTLLTTSKGYTKDDLNKVYTYQDDGYLRKVIEPVNETDTLITISGVIVDGSDNSPILGVSISVKGGQSFTSTDVNGKFKIQIKINPSQKLILVSKYIGYETTETELLSTKTENLQIKLPQSSGLIGEIVIAGGISVKRSLGNRIDSFFRKLFTGRH
jgi:hypothetical protein